MAEQRIMVRPMQHQYKQCHLFFLVDMHPAQQLLIVEGFGIKDFMPIPHLLFHNPASLSHILWVDVYTIPFGFFRWWGLAKLEIVVAHVTAQELCDGGG